MESKHSSLLVDAGQHFTFSVSTSIIIALSNAGQIRKRLMSLSDISFSSLTISVNEIPRILFSPSVLFSRERFCRRNSLWPQYRHVSRQVNERKKKTEKVYPVRHYITSSCATHSGLFLQLDIPGNVNFSCAAMYLERYSRCGTLFNPIYYTVNIRFPR